MVTCWYRLGKHTAVICFSYCSLCKSHFMRHTPSQIVSLVGPTSGPTIVSIG